MKLLRTFSAPPNFNSSAKDFISLIIIGSSSDDLKSQEKHYSMFILLDSCQIIKPIDCKPRRQYQPQKTSFRLLTSCITKNISFKINKLK